MPLVADRVKETTTTAGTGTLTLAGAATGFQSFSAAFGTGAVVYYVIAAGADWEIGIGTTGSGTLSRDTVLQSSNGDALVDWPAGTKDVFCAYVADRAVTTSDPATLTNKTIDDYTNNVGANSTHFRIKAGATLAKGDVVKAVGFTPGEQAIEVVKVASSTDVALGICEQALNTGNFGLAVVIGELFNVNTNGFTAGETLYSNGSGGFTATKPLSGLYQVLGWVVRANASNGVIAVNVVAPLYVEASTNTVNTAVIRDGSGNFAAGTITAALTGNASTATALSSSRTFALTGDVTGSVSSDLTSGASISTAIAAGVIVDADINASAAIADTKLATISTAGKVSNSATTAASASTASAIVARDANGSASFKNVKLDGTTSGTVTVQPAAVAGTWSLTLPTTAGSSGQVLSTDGSGVTSWATAGGTTSVSITPSLTSPYAVTSADVGKRLTVNSTDGSIVNFLTSNTSSIAVGSTVQVAAINTFAALNSTFSNTDVDTVFGNPQINNDVYSVAVQSDGKIIICGVFTSVRSVTKRGIARLNVDGSLDTSYTAEIQTGGYSIYSAVLQADGKLLIGGNFNSVNGQTWNRLARLNTDGTLDTTFLNPSLNGDVYTIAVQSDGKIVIGGTFTSVQGGSYTRQYMARLNTDGTTDTTFNNPGFDSAVYTVAIQSDGKIVVGGSFTTSESGTTFRNYIARINSDGTTDAAFNPSANSLVSNVAVQPDGKILASGYFQFFAGVSRNYIARVTSAGANDATFVGSLSSIPSGYGNNLKVLSNGKILAGAGSQARQLTANGTLEYVFTTAGGAVYSVTLYAFSQQVLVAGSFTYAGYSSILSQRFAKFGQYSTVAGADTVRAPYQFPQIQMPQYAVLKFEKIAAAEWLVTESNAS